VALRAPVAADTSTAAVAEEEQLVIHPPGDTQKRKLLCLLRERLEAGAALLYAEPVEARSEAGRRHTTRPWERRCGAG
jgi:hypothetical protein